MGHDPETLVAELVRQGAVPADSALHAAFRTVLRHWFLPDADLDDVYRDAAVVTHRSPSGVPISSSSQPSVMARMLQQLSVRPGHSVLEIGTGTGYNAALLAELVGPHGRVTTVDVDPEICDAARANLRAAGATNVAVLAGDGWTDVGRGRRFDRVQATVGVSDISRDWIAHLEEDGVLVAPLWLRAGLQASVAFRRTRGGLESTSVEPCAFMRLRGAGAGEPTYEQVGDWTVGLDRPDRSRVDVLGQLLQRAPNVEPAPSLDAGWFTPIALREPDALSLFSAGPGGPVVCCGILDPSAPGLAVVASSPSAGARVQCYGREVVRRRLLGLVDSEQPVEVGNLTIGAVAAGATDDSHGVLASLARPNFTFVITTGSARRTAGG